MSKMAEIHADIRKYEDAGLITQPTMTFAYKHVYGVCLYYPTCEKAELICKLMKRKTLSREIFPELKALGFDVKVVSDLVR